ncbi:MAG: GtrA family protein [Alphaproteobacteria bacterium]
MQALSARLPYGLLPFLVVGGVGFVVDALTLTALVHGLGFDAYVARVLSFAVAVSGTYALNRAWSFRTKAGAQRGREYVRYVAVQVGGVAINFACFAVCIETSTVFAAWPVLALAVGAVVAMIWNYAGARLFTFRG